MNVKLLCLLLPACLASALHGALAELNVAAGTLEAPDGSYSARDFTVAQDFKLELLYVVPADQGSWVPLTWDNKGRLVVASHNSKNVVRLTIPRVGVNEPVKAEKLDLGVGEAHGLLYAFDSLYINLDEAGGSGTGNAVAGGTSGARRNGIYRITDTNKDDTWDKISVIRNIAGSGQHGTHTLKLSPDKQKIFLINGDDTPLTTIQSSRVPLLWGEDNLVLRIPTAFNDYQLAPQGWVADFDQEGKNFELYGMGMRNPVDQAFNKDGELFVYDADMEFDWGTPWYRPTWIGHMISGADFGYRLRASKHPRWYIDNLDSMVNIGAGSPVGADFGIGAKFPARYQDAMFLCDWSYGNLWAVYVNPRGSSYTGDIVPFISGRPFNVTGTIINPADGSMIVQTGGNGQSQLFRVTYSGSESTAPTKPDTTMAAAREVRKGLEKFHGHEDNAAIAAAWPYLNSPDREIRWAARTAIEWQNQSKWRDRALAEVDPRTSIAAIVALARANGKDDYHRPADYPAPDKALQERMLQALDRIDWNALAYQDKLELIRAYELTLIRLGAPSAATRERLIAKFDPLLPANQRELNWDLAEVLAYLDAPSAPAKLMALLRNAPSAPYYQIREYINPILRQRGNPGMTGPQGETNATLMKQEDQQQYAELLRVTHNGWTRELREEYLRWFPTAATSYRGGSAFVAGLQTMRADAISQIPEAERAALQEAIALPLNAGRGGAGGGAGAAGGGRAGAAGAAAGRAGAPANAGAPATGRAGQ
jgi:hypothetical protein